MPGYEWLRRAAFATQKDAPPLRSRRRMALVFVLAVGKAVADPFKPFLYFRF